MAENLQEEVEDKVIDCITLGSGGRLVVYKPENMKTVLAVGKKGGYNGEEIFLDVFGIEKPGSAKLEDKINLLTGSEDLKGGENFYLLFVYFDAVKQDLEETFWLIPSLKIIQLKKGADLSKFLMSRKEFVNFLVDECLKK